MFPSMGHKSLAQWFNVHEGSTNNCLRFYRSQHNFQLFQTVSLPPPVRHQTKGKKCLCGGGSIFPFCDQAWEQQTQLYQHAQAKKTNAFFIIASIIYEIDDTDALLYQGNIKLN